MFDEDFDGKFEPDGMKKHYTTDFLFRKAKKRCRKDIDGGQPFTMMLSIPDPDNLDIMRVPYDTMYESMNI